MQSIYYDVPSTLKREREILEAKCDLLIEAFNQLCVVEKERLREEKEKLLASRVFRYSVKDVGNGWSVLYKETDTVIQGRTDDKQWSKMFKILNNVLIIADTGIDNKSWMEPTELLGEERILEDGFDAHKLTGW